MKMGDSSSPSNMKDDLVISNILCYMSTARHSLRADDIIRACLLFYNKDDILKGKDMLYDLVNEKSRRRRNGDRILHELQDIMHLLKKCDDESVKLPKFLADARPLDFDEHFLPSCLDR